jgi:hypothetical protein
MLADPRHCVRHAAALREMAVSVLGGREAVRAAAVAPTG